MNMSTFGKKIGGWTPSINQNDIVNFLSQVTFREIDIDGAKSTAFFMKFKTMYNGVPVFHRYTSDDYEKLKQCFEWLGFDTFRNDIEVNGYKFSDGGDPMEYQFKSYKINPIIYSLLNNDSLKPISDIDGEIGFEDLEEEYKELENFKKIIFTEVSPFTLDGELTELALRGSVYLEWKESTKKTKLMATEFVDQIIDGRYDDFKIYRTHECWSGYILGYFIAYFMFDSKKGEFWILSKDDYD